MNSQSQANINMLRSIIKNDDFITSDKFLLNSGLNFSYYKRDFLFRSGDWRGSQANSVWKDIQGQSGKNLVIGHSDLKTNAKHLRILQALRIRRVFGANTLNLPGISESIPLGLTNDCDDSPIHRILGNTNHLRMADEHSNFKETFDGSIYLNFNLNNNYKARKLVIDSLQENRNVTKDEVNLSDSGRVKYLCKIRESSLVPCPEGGGIDTHRLWEVIYMGGTPVVLRNGYLPEILSRLPVIQIQSWSLLQNKSLMEKLWYEVHSMTYNFLSLTPKHWTDRMNYLGNSKPFA